MVYYDYIIYIYIYIYYIYYSHNGGYGEFKLEGICDESIKLVAERFTAAQIICNSSDQFLEREFTSKQTSDCFECWYFSITI